MNVPVLPRRYMKTKAAVSQEAKLMYCFLVFLVLVFFFFFLSFQMLGPFMNQFMFIAYMLCRNFFFLSPWVNFLLY